jgi:FAD/FMN-containing dehydrogenase
MVEMGSWGRLGTWPHRLRPLNGRAPTALPLDPGSHGLAYGMGRSYGDVCLNPGGTLWTTRSQDRFIAWDENEGVLTCEAGVLLRDIQQLFVPRGWMLPVTPGTQLVTVGGAIANDVHGKNHHVFGSFGEQVTHLRLLRTDGEVMDCGPMLRPDWFAATVGGLGLTGVITQASLRLRRVRGPWIDSQTIPFNGLDEFLDLADSSEPQWEHTVAWIDCIAGRTARGIFIRGNLSADGDAGKLRPSRQRTVPFVPPVSLVNRLSVRPFNWAYYHLNRLRAGRRRVRFEPFFYPLDHIRDWNRMYGPSGFYQYQCVVPRRWGKDAIGTMLREISDTGEGSFLAVLKTFGQREAPGMLSFAQAGVTLALDFPNKGASTGRLFQRLDAVLKDAQGRLYPAKDARMSPALFAAGYPRLQEFLRHRDPGIRSGFSLRIMGS